MNFQQAIDTACQQPTLVDALSWIAVWECERVIPVAHSFLTDGRPRGSGAGQGWDTCFRVLIKEVMEQYGQQKTLKVLKGKK